MLLRATAVPTAAQRGVLPLIRGQEKRTAVSIVPGLRLDTNPIVQPAGTARLLRNFVFERHALRRKEFSPDFTAAPFTFGDDGTIETSATLAGAGATQADGSASTPAWSNASNITASDDTYATAVFGVGAEGSTEYLRASGFGFSIPLTATITGIEVHVEGKRTGSLVTTIGKVFLVVNGSQAGSEKLFSAFGTSDSTITSGSYNDLWGTRRISASEVNDPSFGVDVRWTLERIIDQTAETISVDAISITVHYSFPVWKIVDFQYHRGSAPYSKCIIFRANGKVYERQSGWEQEIFPAHYGFTALSKKPFAAVLPNRLFFSDGTASYVYDGRTMQTWGLGRSTTAPSVVAANVGGSIVAATGVKACVTWVVLDEAGNRVHEGSRSAVNASFVVIGGADDAVTVDVSALSIPSRATHWSAYISELDGSEVFRRAATTVKSTTSVTVSTFPASTNAKAPIRNDVVPETTVGGVAKNRIFVRDDENPNKYLFSALGEVKGLSNGSAEESFPDSTSSSSTSDISNSDVIVEREIRAFVDHENIVFVFGRDKGYALIGELNLLDNRAPRSLVKLQQFPEGCAGPDAATSTPYGLAYLTPQRKIHLWAGGEELVDIGEPVQKILDTIAQEDLGQSELFYWGGDGRAWLMCSLRVKEHENVAASIGDPHHKILVFDFKYLAQRPDGSREQGSWKEWTDIEATTIANYRDYDGHQFLLAGDLFGHVKQLDTMCQPTHLNLSFTLGKAYLEDAPANNPACRLKTGMIHPNGDGWCVVQYMVGTFGDEMIPGTAGGFRYSNNQSSALTNGTLTSPTVEYAVDNENADVSPSTAITLMTALSTGEQRGWLGDGQLCKNVQLEAQWAAGVDVATEAASSRTVAMFNTMYKLALLHSPKKEDTL